VDFPSRPTACYAGLDHPTNSLSLSNLAHRGPAHGSPSRSQSSIKAGAFPLVPTLAAQPHDR